MAPRKKETKKTLPTREEFFSALMRNLIEARKNDPEGYGDGDRGKLDFMTIYQRYVTNLNDGAFGRFSPLIRTTCESFGFRASRETIEEILKNDGGVSHETK